MGTEVVPFGKYKGQPLEALAADRQYTDWLMQQPWFRERHKNLYTVVINNFAEPSETPEHNALQVLFLDPDYREAFIRHIGQMSIRFQSDFGRISRPLTIDELISEARSDFKWHLNWRFESMKKENELFAMQTSIASIKTDVSFEKKGVDVILKFWARLEVNSQGLDLDPDYAKSLNHGSGEHPSTWVTIEVKPTVGDDYPAVLRQMLAGQTDYLFIQSYTGVGATLDQFRKVFEASGKQVVFRHEVEALLPS